MACATDSHGCVIATFFLLTPHELVLTSLSMTVQGLQDKMAAVEARSSVMEAKHKAAIATLGALRATISHIFDEIGCNTAATRKLLGDLGVTESNVLQHLALIEQRASEVMALYFQKLSREGVPVVQARTLP